MKCASQPPRSTVRTSRQDSDRVATYGDCGSLMAKRRTTRQGMAITVRCKVRELTRLMCQQQATTLPLKRITDPLTNTTFICWVDDRKYLTPAPGDSDGIVSKVDFYQGATLLGTDTSIPYYLCMEQCSQRGVYSLTAKATDDNAAVTTSSAITINSQPGASGPALAFAERD